MSTDDGILGSIRSLRAVFFVADFADKFFKRRGAKITLVLNRVSLVFIIDEDGWSGPHILSSGVLANDLSGGLKSDIDVAELDSLIFDGFDGSQTFPLNSEFLALSASWVNVGNDPNVLSVPDNSLLEVLDLETLGFAPWAIACLVSGLVGASEFSEADGDLLDWAW